MSANDGRRRSVGPLSPLFAFYPFPIKLSHKPAQSTGLPLHFLVVGFVATPIFRRVSPSEFQALLALPLEPQPISAIDGRRRSIRTRVTPLRPRSTVRELPFIIPPLNVPVTRASSLCVGAVTDVGGSKRRCIDRCYRISTTRLCDILLGSRSQDLGLRSRFHFPQFLDPPSVMPSSVETDTTLPLSR